MSVVGSIVVNSAMRTSEFSAGIAQASSDLAAFSNHAEILSRDFEAVGQSVNSTGSSIANTIGQWERLNAIAVKTSAISTVAARALFDIAHRLEFLSLAAKAASIAGNALAATLNWLLRVAAAIAAPFLFLAKVAASITVAFRSFASGVAFALTPLGAVITALKIFIAIAGAAVIVIKSIGLAFRTLRSVLTLNVVALAANTAKLVAMTAALAGLAAVKVASVSFAAFKSVLTGLTTAAAGAAAALGFVAFRAAATVDKAGDTADQLGTTTAALSSLRYAATLTGSDAESLDSALAKLNVNLGDAATKGGPAADALKRIGLDAQQLAAMDPTLAFEAIAGGLQGIDTPAERAAIAMDLFGRGGLSVLTTLQAGPAELQRLSKEFGTLGGAVTESQRAAVGAMFDAFDRIGAVVSGLGAQIAVKLAPFVEALASSFVRLWTEGGAASALLEPGINALGFAVEYVGHAIDFAQLGWIGFKSLGLQALSQVAYGVSSLGKGFASVINLIPGMNVTFGETAGLMGDELKRLADEADQQGQRLLASRGFGEEFRANFDRIRDSAASMKGGLDEGTKSIKKMGEGFGEATGKARELIDRLKEQRDTFGMSSTAAEVYKLRQAGASEATIAQAESIAKEIQALEKAKETQDKYVADATSIFEATRTPLEKFQAELNRIETLRSSGVLGSDVAARAAADAKKGFLGESATKQAAALELGSKEARSAILSFRGQGQDKPLNEVARSTSETAKQAAIQNSLLQRLIDRVDKAGTDAIPVL